jgi:hypothetical protein
MLATVQVTHPNRVFERHRHGTAPVLVRQWVNTTHGDQIIVRSSRTAACHAAGMMHESRGLIRSARP